MDAAASPWTPSSFLREAGVSYLQVWHPYAAIPSVLVPIAAVLGWIGRS